MIRATRMKKELEMMKKVKEKRQFKAKLLLFWSSLSENLFVSHCIPTRTPLALLQNDVELEPIVCRWSE
jgi:hypothetical protein